MYIYITQVQPNISKSSTGQAQIKQILNKSITSQAKVKHKSSTINNQEPPKDPATTSLLLDVFLGRAETSTLGIDLCLTCTYFA